MKNAGRIYELKSYVQHYPWGCRAHDGQAPYIADLLGQDAGKQAWAELWIGAHPSLCSRIVTDAGEQPLNEFIAQDEDGILGNATQAAGFHQLPFLLKVLSCERALSIQSHPDKKSAERLHENNSRRYRDDNHKPEIMIGLTEFRAMAGFRPAAEAMADLERLNCTRSWRRICYAADTLTPRVLCETLLSMPASMVRPMLAELRKELDARAQRTEREELVVELMSQYQCDRGVLFGFLLNLVHLNPGEYLYIPPNEPHAYLNGTGVECMANSDNVIRAGLTQKTIDTHALLGTLTFKDGTMAAAQGKLEREGVRLYASPAREYEVRIVEGVEFDFSVCASVPGVALVLDGSFELTWPDGGRATAVRGSTWFWPAALSGAKARPLGNGSRLAVASVPLG